MTRGPEDPPDTLQELFRADEAGIGDDGFSIEVMKQARGGFGWRRTVLYGAAMAGFGAAVAGILEMAPYLPRFSGWWAGVNGALQSGAGQSGGAPDLASAPLFLLGALAAGASFFLLAVASQER